MATACALATAAAAALEVDLVGVDLLPVTTGDYVVLEVNGAVDLTSEYSPAGGDVVDDVARIVTSDAAALDAGATASGGG